MRNLPAIWSALLFSGLLLSVGGCVTSSQPRKPAAQVNLMVTRAMDKVNLSWQSVRGQVYTIQMRDRNRPDAKWEFHPQALNLVGTGTLMSFKDSPPPGSNRQYRLHLLPVSGSRTTPPR